MSNTKKQLMTAIAMLVVAALALGTSTYAWFVSNTTVKVDEMTFTAQTVDNLEIALTTTAWDGSFTATNATAAGFKTLITSQELSDLYVAKSASLTGSALIPASTINGQSFWRVADGESSWETQLGTGLTVAKTFTNVTNISDNSVKAIPLFLKSTTNTSIYLANTTTVAGAAAPAARIAIVENASSTKFIWAPSTAHIDDNKITTINDADGITNAVSGANNTGAISPSVSQTMPTGEILQLTANQPKLVMVYIWLEGCDVDCVSGLSAKDLTVNLAFTSQAV
ncbi:MAG: hypothetical protein IJU59_04610 [Firmicutes bacterium]|nr:hypothetical protein [Bacillota bacterium]